MSRQKSSFRLIILSIPLVLFTSSVTFANGLELSGHVSVLAGWQHDDSDTVPQGRGGLQNFVTTPSGPNTDFFGFFIDEVEIDLDKKLSDKVWLRGDLQFFDLDGPRGTGFMDVEQGYVGFMLGNVETIIGKFVAPIGFENTADYYDNIHLTISNTGGPTPTLVAGIQVMYPVTQNFDFYWYVVNSLNNGGFADPVIPSFGTRFELSWGEEANPNYMALNFVAGPERPGSNNSAGWEYLADMEFSFMLGEKFLLGGEGFYLYWNETIGGTDDQLFSVFLIGQYSFTQTFYGYLRGEFLSDNDAAGNGDFTGDDQKIYDGAIGIGYSLADDTLVKWEYRLDWHDPDGGDKSLSHAITGSFAYTF